MPLEAATTINQLEPSNPASTDQLAQADEHLRLIKSVLKNTFPNITGPVTATQAALNTPIFTIPIGLILNWYGESGTIPAGWAQCNGQTVTRSDGAGNITTPDLRDKVVVGAGSGIAARGVSAGSTTDTVTTGTAGSHAHSVATSGSHTHAIAVLAHAITEAEMPAHKHANGVTDKSTGYLFNHGTLAASPGTSHSISDSTNPGTLEGYTTTVGSGTAHSHGVTIDPATTDGGSSTSSDGVHSHSATVSTIQPSFGLHFIMKV